MPFLVTYTETDEFQDQIQTVIDATSMYLNDREDYVFHCRDRNGVVARIPRKNVLSIEVVE